MIEDLDNNMIITQLFDANTTDYFATHFQSDSSVPPNCHPSWNNDNFIDSTFRDLTPSSANIICALYGE